jgi:hypothetical protein
MSNEPKREVHSLPLDSILYGDGKVPKLCPGCGEMKTISDFYTKSNQPKDTDGRSKCIECIKSENQEDRKNREGGNNGKGR